MQQNSTTSWCSGGSGLSSTRAVFFLLITVCVANKTWAQPCDSWCANSDTFNRTINPPVPGQGQYWVARRNPLNSRLITFSADGNLISQVFSPSNMSFRDPPALQYFDQRIVITIRADDQHVYANTYTNLNDGLGARWTGWATDLMRPFLDFSPGIASKIPAGQTGILVVAAKDPMGGVWTIRSTSMANGFADGWRQLGCCAPPNFPSLACGDPGQLRVGGTGSDNRCYRRTSVDGLNWPPPDQVISPCP